jgi:hypothetical protein
LTVLAGHIEVGDGTMPGILSAVGDETIDDVVFVEVETITIAVEGGVAAEDSGTIERVSCWPDGGGEDDDARTV